MWNQLHSRVLHKRLRGKTEKKNVTANVFRVFAEKCDVASQIELEKFATENDWELKKKNEIFKMKYAKKKKKKLLRWLLPLGWLFLTVIRLYYEELLRSSSNFIFREVQQRAQKLPLCIGELEKHIVDALRNVCIYSDERDWKSRISFWKQSFKAVWHAHPISCFLYILLSFSARNIRKNEKKESL